METSIAEISDHLKLSPLDQIMPRVYSRIILPIPLQNTERDSSVQHLHQGLAATVKDIPLLKGTVVHSTRLNGRVDVRMMQEADWQSIWKIKDLVVADPEHVLDLTNIRAKSFPMSLLPDDILAPVSTFPDPSKPAPVMAAQVNKVSGGLLLCVAFHHSVFDAAGFSTVMKRWACHCTSDGNTETLDPGAFDREPLMNGVSAGNPNDFKEYTIPTVAEDQPKPEQTVQQPALPTMKTVILHFPALALKKLKEDMVSSVKTDLISTNDCLCALLWWYITCARFATKSKDSSENSTQAENLPSQTSLGFAINGRPRCDPPLPETYLGNVNLYGMPSFPLSLLMQSSVRTLSHLASLARLIREAISSVDAVHIKRVIGLINSLPDPTLLTPGFQNFLGPDLAITSWAALGLNGLRFFNNEDNSRAGHNSSSTQSIAWGCVEAVRIPQATFDGLCIILPRLMDEAKSGQKDGLEVVVGLQEDAMERLIDAKNGIWQYAESVVV